MAVAGRDEHLAEVSDAVCRMGSLMLSSGTGSFRVKAAMGRVASALGVEQLEARVAELEAALAPPADPADELAETAAKMRPMLDALDPLPAARTGAGAGVRSPFAPRG